MLMEDDFLFLLYTDFSYISTVFLMLSHVRSCCPRFFALISGFLPVWYCLSLSSHVIPWLIMISFLLIMLSPIVLPDVLPVWLCYATYGGEVLHAIILISFLLIMSSLMSSPCLIMYFSLSSQVSLCLIMFSSCSHCFPHVVLMVSSEVSWWGSRRFYDLFDLMIV